MKFTKNHDNGKRYILSENNKEVIFSYEGNGDLYISYYINNQEREPDGISNTFIITKENYKLYELFDNLLPGIQMKQQAKSLIT